MSHARSANNFDSSLPELTVKIREYLPAGEIIEWEWVYFSAVDGTDEAFRLEQDRAYRLEQNRREATRREIHTRLCELRRYAAHFR